MPASISDRAGYAATLGVFYRLYAPLERALATYTEWAGLGLDLGERRQSDRLVADLALLGARPSGSPADGYTWLNSFPRGLGALYVLEESTLGGRIILRQLQDQDIGIPAGAMTFLGGHGVNSRAMWLSFVASLDTFGARHEGLQGGVEQGASLMFRAIISGFQQASPPEQSTMSGSAEADGLVFSSEVPAASV